MIPRSYPVLRALSASIAEKWQTLLHIEAVRNPLAAPEILAHSIPGTINLILDRAERNFENLDAPRRSHPWDNRCFRNPHSWFYIAGEQAMLEALIFAQTGSAQEREAELAAFCRAIDEIAEEDVGNFCKVCLEYPNCPIRVCIPVATR